MIVSDDKKSLVCSHRERTTFVTSDKLWISNVQVIGFRRWHPKQKFANVQSVKMLFIDSPIRDCCKLLDIHNNGKWTVGELSFRLKDNFFTLSVPMNTLTEREISQYWCKYMLLWCPWKWRAAKQMLGPVIYYYSLNNHERFAFKMLNFVTNTKLSCTTSVILL